MYRITKRNKEKKKLHCLYIIKEIYYTHTHTTVYTYFFGPVYYFIGFAGRCFGLSPSPMWDYATFWFSFKFITSIFFLESWEDNKRCCLRKTFPETKLLLLLLLEKWRFRIIDKFKRKSNWGNKYYFGFCHGRDLLVGRHLIRNSRHFWW
jgi:hypothetical protein